MLRPWVDRAGRPDPGSSSAGAAASNREGRRRDRPGTSARPIHRFTARSPHMQRVRRPSPHSTFPQPAMTDKGWELEPGGGDAIRDIAAVCDRGARGAPRPRRPHPGRRRRHAVQGAVGPGTDGPRRHWAAHRLRPRPPRHRLPRPDRARRGHGIAGRRDGSRPRHRGPAREVGTPPPTVRDRGRHGARGQGQPARASAHRARPARRAPHVGRRERGRGPRPRRVPLGRGRHVRHAARGRKLVTLGATRGRVARLLDGGFAVQFLRLLPLETFGAAQAL